MTKFLRRLGGGLFLLLLVMLSVGFIAREATFSGPVISPTGLPKGEIVDMHIHLAGYGNNSDCYVSDSLKNNYRFDQYLAGFGVTKEEVEAKGDQIVVDKIARQFKQSKTVSTGVLLALDGAVTPSGKLDKLHTEVYIPNDYVAEQVKRFPQYFHFGASINPYRKDALARLEKVKQQGAVLVKWIPNIQHIDPSDAKLIPFYKKMKALKLPLLSHTGQERSFSKALDNLGDPRRLELPLSLGVKVIAAHIATTGISKGEDNFERILPMFEEYKNLYADISSLTQINKLGFLNRAIKEPRLKGRLVYGSDFPLSNMYVSSAWYFPLNLTAEKMSNIAAIDNHWDRDISLKQALGVSSDMFTRGAEVLGLD